MIINLSNRHFPVTLLCSRHIVPIGVCSALNRLQELKRTPLFSRLAAGYAS